MQRQEALLSTREKTGQWWHGDTGGARAGRELRRGRCHS